MAAINIYNVESFSNQVIDCVIESVGDNQFTVLEEQTPSPPFLTGVNEVIRVKVTHEGISKYIYCMYINQTYDGTDYRLVLGYDQDIYGDYVSVNKDVQQISYYEQDPDDVIMPVDVYSVVSELNVATYSKSYKAYNISENYSISIPRKKYNFTETVKKLYLYYDDKILVDGCNKKCYKVSPGDLTANSLNNKFSSSVTLNVLIK